MNYKSNAHWLIKLSIGSKIYKNQLNGNNVWIINIEWKLTWDLKKKKKKEKQRLIKQEKEKAI